MSRRYMLDTNTVSYIVKGRSAVARDKLSGLPINDIAYLSSITEAEVRYGLAKRPQAKRLHATVEAFLTKIRVLDWGRDEAFVYGQLRAKREALGKTLANLDMLIVAHAIAVDAVLVSNDKALAQVTDLRATENWATDLL